MAFETKKLWEKAVTGELDWTGGGLTRDLGNPPAEGTVEMAELLLLCNKVCKLTQSPLI